MPLRTLKRTHLLRSVHSMPRARSRTACTSRCVAAWAACTSSAARCAAHRDFLSCSCVDAARCTLYHRVLLTHSPFHTFQHLALVQLPAELLLLCFRLAQGGLQRESLLFLLCQGSLGVRLTLSCLLRTLRRIPRLR